jgi:PhnB protein
MQMRFKDNPDKPGPEKVPPAFDQRIMHACVRIAGAELFMSDGMRSGPTDFDCVSLSLNLPTDAEADRIFNALAADGKVTMPIGKTFFAQRFSGVTNKFGVQDGDRAADDWLKRVAHRRLNHSDRQGTRSPCYRGV